LTSKASVREFLSAPVLSAEDANNSYFVLHSGSLLAVTDPDRIRIRVVWLSSSPPASSRWQCTVSGQFVTQ
jgi:hypothetical protein